LSKLVGVVLKLHAKENNKKKGVENRNSEMNLSSLRQHQIMHSIYHLKYLRSEPLFVEA